MKKYFWMLVSLIGLLGTSVFATYEDFSSQLTTMGLDVQKITSQNSISRYDLSRVLNSVECKDCIHPKDDMISRYEPSFWSNFIATPGKDFSDIGFGGATYNELSYYYCVAYVGDNTYMRGYPKATSPVCGGNFCGTKNTTTAEFIQVVINILANYVYKDIYLNRKNVNLWINKLKPDSYEIKNFTDDDKKAIAEKSKACENTCALQDAGEVNLYLKYCMFNIAKCNMQEIGKIKQGYRPVAELNLLYSQNIINIDQTQRRNTDRNIDGKTVIETLFKLNGKVNCTFNNDYDCDGSDNAKDNCPNTYNPHQTDRNSNRIGDVCSDDIDGDGIKNPLGIVDDNGNIDISTLLQTGTMDNCLFVVNTGQEDTNHNFIGDTCENQAGHIGIYITMDGLKGIAPLTTRFTAISQGDVHDTVWDFGDGSQGNGVSITHTFLTPGMYTVQATAKGSTTDAKAQVTVIIGGQRGDDKALEAKASVVGGRMNTETTLSTAVIGKFDRIEWIFPKENSTSQKDTDKSFKKIFRTTGENPVIVKGYSNGKLAGVSYFTIGIDAGRGAILGSNMINPEIHQKILFDTKTYNISQDDILSVDRDFSDGTKISNTALTMEYSYADPGKKIVTQTITCTDGSKLTNMMTINVIDKTVFASYALLMTPSQLIAHIGEKINFSTRIVGTLLKTPSIQIMDFADGILQKRPGTEKMPSLFVHAYQKDGSLTPENSMYINQCTYLDNQATLSINGNDRCLDAKLQGTLNKTYTCDLDGDRTPDICDSDIDGDEIPNLLGLINFENKDCSYESDPSKANANLNQEMLARHYQGVCSLDNAPFNANNDQLDLNQDDIGDVQRDILSTSESGEIDTDGDGTADIQDICPTIQGIINNNGCPIVGQELGCNPISPFIGFTNDTFIIKSTDISTPLLSCGNKRIESGENCKNCPVDVGICTSLCGNGTAEPGENCNNCPADVPSCGTCGNGIKDPHEDCKSCPQDYGSCSGTGFLSCGNGIIDQGEVCTNCPQDVRLCIDIPNIGSCNQCPCQFADIADDLTNDDQVRAILRNKEKTIQYKFSLPWIVDFQQ